MADLLTTPSWLRVGSSNSWFICSIKSRSSLHWTEKNKQSFNLSEIIHTQWWIIMFQAIWLVWQFTPFSDILFLQSHVWSWRQKQNGWHGVLPEFRVRILENPSVDVFKVKKTLQSIENSFPDLLLLNFLFCCFSKDNNWHAQER